ncbi:hypothetical protein C8Q76DRAFT_139618 [Earliella scabrosa]|nr:hypothetical protein C8Q76DRAFT_139618 [Earliella scabrosa]
MATQRLAPVCQAVTRHPGLRSAGISGLVSLSRLVSCRCDPCLRCRAETSRLAFCCSTVPRPAGSGCRVRRKQHGRTARDAAPAAAHQHINSWPLRNGRLRTEDELRFDPLESPGKHQQTQGRCWSLNWKREARYQNDIQLPIPATRVLTLACTPNSEMRDARR